MDNQFQLVILVHLSKYEFYVYAFTSEIHDRYTNFLHLESCSDTWKCEFRKFFTSCCPCPFNMNVVLLNKFIGKIPRKLDIKDDIINKVDKCYQ